MEGACEKSAGVAGEEAVWRPGVRRGGEGGRGQRSGRGVRL